MTNEERITVKTEEANKEPSASHSVEVETVPPAPQAEPAELVEELAEERVELEAMKAMAEEQRVLAADYLDQWKRLQAEFDNFRKREDKQKQNLKALAVENTVLEFLSVADNLERAMTASAQENTSVESLVQGIRMVCQQLDTVLKKMNVERLNVLGEVFDPMKHEAVSQGPSLEFEKDRVMQVFQNGWVLNQKIIRPAMVMVSEGSTESK